MKKLPLKLSIVAVMLLIGSAIIASSFAYAAGLNIQATTNKFSYSQGATITVRALASSNSVGLLSSNIKSAKISIKNPSGKTVVSGAAMAKDATTGLCLYKYKLPASAAEGKWVIAITISGTSGAWGNGTKSFRVKGPVPNHSKFISSYEGPKTCIKCHDEEANAIFNSVHYQWRGDTSKAIELKASGSKASKLGGMNDFCIWPDGNWLTILNKVDGTKGPGGCATCHTGLGLRPSATVSQGQLENIDCLMCHGPGYSRKVVEKPDATFSLAPADGVDVLKVAQSITRPTREMCMRCHEKSGGGDNNKRGDLESTIKNCTSSYDVHMGTNGQNFTCQDCHKMKGHRVIGRGSDMRTLDSTTELKCESCHTTVPHSSTNESYAALNKHIKRLDCTVCHIPSFAKSISTDMNRDWSILEVDKVKQLYEPKITRQSNVKPTYAWFNGNSHFYEFGTPVSLDSRGVQKMSWPDGSISDLNSKIYPFKLHTAKQPMESTTRQLLPVKNKIAYETGDLNKAIAEGAKAAGITYNSHTFAQTERYLGIYHGVGPKSTALSCSNQSCHETGGSRIKFSELGYSRRATNGELCGVCHSLKTNPGFMKVHRIHRNGETRICSTCHGSGTPLKESRSTLCDNCHEAKSMSDAAKIHSKHVKGEGIDCGNCHTFSSGGLVKRGESGEGDEGEKSEDNEKNDKSEGKTSNVTQNHNVTSERHGEHDADRNKNEKHEGGKSDRDDD